MKTINDLAIRIHNKFSKDNIINKIKNILKNLYALFLGFIFI